MKCSLTSALALACALTVGAAPVSAHFQELIPSPPLVTGATGPDVTLDLTFTHPMENGPEMVMGAPRQFGVLVNGARRSLLDDLEPVERNGARAYRAALSLEGPGDHVFFLEPAPYWEPAEGVMIVHYTKVILDAFAADEGWDAMVGFPVEIQPLTRPYGLYAGNLFSGVVTRDGRPVPFAEVEVEYRSEGRIDAPADVFITQTLKADANGVFHYAMPRSGWWAFAALLEGPEPLANPEGTPVPVEQGALIWVHAVDMPNPRQEP